MWDIAQSIYSHGAELFINTTSKNYREIWIKKCNTEEQKKIKMMTKNDNDNFYISIKHI